MVLRAVKRSLLLCVFVSLWQQFLFRHSLCYFADNHSITQDETETSRLATKER